MAASVWMKSYRPLRPEGMMSRRSLAETMPTETECDSPKGLPMAITHSPIFTASESPR